MARDDVLIVGAGPTGLALALWLTKQGLRVRIVDRTAGPGTTSRAVVVQPRTLELYRQLDLAEEVVAAGNKTPAINLWIRGKRQARLSFGDVGRELTPYPYVLIYPQDAHERLLVDRLEALGVTVERQTEFIDFEEKGDHVVARLREAAGVERQVEARFVVGCDGARSAVRHEIGAGFPGGTYEQTFYVADVSLSGPTADGEAHLSLATADFLAFFPFSEPGRGRLIGTIDDASGELAGKLTFDDVGHAAIEALGLTVEKVNWFSTYRVHHRVTDHYRRGRAFLLGDAAHVHSPAGGQGMNTGIGDAINLAWKLAAVIRGAAPDSLLDTYEAERRAFALRLVETTDRIFTFVTAEGDFADFMRTRIAPLFVPLAYGIGPLRQYAFRLVSQTMISYRDCDLNEGEAGKVRGGDRLPWVRDGASDNYASLAGIGWQVHVYGTAQADLEGWCREHGVALHTFPWTAAHRHAGLGQDAAYLLRPDSYVAFAEPAGSAAAVAAYLTRHALTPGLTPAAG